MTLPDTEVSHLLLKDRKIGYIITDLSLIVTHVKGVVEVLGITASAVVGQYLPDLIPELIGTEPLLEEILQDSLPKFELNWVNRYANGQPIYINIINLPYRNPTGEITGLLHLAEDVTEMGEMEQELVQQRNELRLLKHILSQRNAELNAANEQLRTLDRLKSKFMSITAHELRSPLAVIQGNVEMVIDGDYGPISSQQTQVLDTTLSATLRLSHITNTLLDSNRIALGQIELALRPLDLTQLVQQVIHEWQPQFVSKQQILAFHIAEPLPEVLGDRVRLAQILTNLLTNAHKYTPEQGQIEVRLTMIDDGQAVELVVQDNGIGIAPDDQQRLFGSFFRADDVQNSEIEGVGLGLHITQQLVALHNGQIRVESELNVGTTFFVIFPIKHSD